MVGQVRRPLPASRPGTEPSDLLEIGIDRRQFRRRRVGGSQQLQGRRLAAPQHRHHLVLKTLVSAAQFQPLRNNLFERLSIRHWPASLKRHEETEDRRDAAEKGDRLRYMRQPGVRRIYGIRRPLRLSHPAHVFVH